MTEWVGRLVYVELRNGFKWAKKRLRFLACHSGMKVGEGRIEALFKVEDPLSVMLPLETVTVPLKVPV